MFWRFDPYAPALWQQGRRVPYNRGRCRLKAMRVESGTGPERPSLGSEPGDGWPATGSSRSSDCPLKFPGSGTGPERPSPGSEPCDGWPATGSPRSSDFPLIHDGADTPLHISHNGAGIPLRRNSSPSRRLGPADFDRIAKPAQRPEHFARSGSDSITASTAPERRRPLRSTPAPILPRLPTCFMSIDGPQAPRTLHISHNGADTPLHISILEIHAG
jgi:hypothetical protein